MKELKGTKTHDNLKAAVRRRIAGEPPLPLFREARRTSRARTTSPRVFRSTAEGETGHAHGHLDYLAAVGDPATGPADRRDARQPEGRRSPAKRTSTPTCIRAWRRPRASEGFDEIADWFETLAKAERSHANRFQKALDALGRLT